MREVFHEKICNENLWIEDDDQRQRRNRSEMKKLNKYSTNQGEDENPVASFHF